ncbi:hypothetical protein Dsin_018019 [Dipteronia sinensis]|uniref:Pectinesterase n=1 Tax=Dipteronia sinensis TaxID=43782 RepID=A0AAE0AH21_9ROSI|nr:hypothetical protein Dsin_018019 [Dipteronia sinensis]
MVFQDFDHIQERRRMERERKFRKRVTIGAISAFVLVILIAAAVFAAVTIPKNNKSDDNKSSDKPKEVSKVGKLIATVCQVTAYKNSCNDTLTKAVPKNATSLEPRQLLKYAMAAASEEAGKAFDKINGLKFDDPKEQTAWEYCKELAEQAKGEFSRSLGGVVLKESFGLRNLTSRASDLKSWLSAVISYGEMCSDAFPEGQKRTDMEKLWTVTKHLTDNSLALVTQFTNYISSMNLKDQQTGRRLLQDTNGHSVDNEVPLVTEETNGHSVDDYIPPEWMIQDQLHSGRHLLEEEINGHSVDDYIPPDVVDQTDGHSLDEEGFPTWITAGDRRMLAQTGRSKRPKPNIIVAKDGSGNYKTVSEAIKAVPKQFPGRFVIYVKEGIYNEKVVIPYGMSNITMYGDGSQKSIITGNKGVKDGLLLHQTSTIQILGHGFMAQSIGFRNTAGAAKEQAVAAQVQSDCAIFINCRFEGYQDTLWAATHRQFYKKCMIIGTVDFIFGDAAALFQNCVIQLRKPNDGQHNVITASGRVEANEATGIVIQNCKIVAHESLKVAKNSVNSYLSRPWKDLGRSIIMESTIGDFIAPEGYVPFRGNKGINTVFFAEYNNKGPGAGTSKRVKWSGVKMVKNRNNIWYFTAKPFIQGDWISKLGIEVHFGFYSK